MHPAHAFEWPIYIADQHLDALQHVNNVVYLQWVQEVAAAHWAALSANSGIDLVWVVRRHELDYLKPAFKGDVLTAYTWVGDSKGALSVRHVHILNEKGELILQAQTTWCALDKKKFRPIRINDDLIRILASTKK